MVTTLDGSVATATATMKKRIVPFLTAALLLPSSLVPKINFPFFVFLFFSFTPFFVFFDLGCRYPGQSPGGLQLRWCFVLFRILVIDHVYNRVKHGNVTQLDTVPVDDLFLTIFYLAYLRTLTLSR